MRVSDEIRWGVVGPGRIAENVMPDFAHVPGARPVAVASRSADRAAAFAERHGLERAHDSYADIVADPDVDVLYLATPHPQHCAVALAALDVPEVLHDLLGDAARPDDAPADLLAHRQHGSARGRLTPWRC